MDEVDSFLLESIFDRCTLFIWNVNNDSPFVVVRHLDMDNFLRRTLVRVQQNHHMLLKDRNRKLDTNMTIARGRSVSIFNKIQIGVQEKRVDAMLTAMFARYCKLLQDETGTWLTKSQKAYQLMTETESDQLLCESTYNLESIKLSEVQGGWIKEFHSRAPFIGPPSVEVQLIKAQIKARDSGEEVHTWVTSDPSYEIFVSSNGVIRYTTEFLSPVKLPPRLEYLTDMSDEDGENCEQDIVGIARNQLEKCKNKLSQITLEVQNLQAELPDTNKDLKILEKVLKVRKSEMELLEVKVDKLQTVHDILIVLEEQEHHEQLLKQEEDESDSYHLKETMGNAKKAAVKSDDFAAIDTMADEMYLNDSALHDGINSLQKSAITVETQEFLSSEFRIYSDQDEVLPRQEYTTDISAEDCTNFERDIERILRDQVKKQKKKLSQTTLEVENLEAELNSDTDKDLEILEKVLKCRKAEMELLKVKIDKFQSKYDAIIALENEEIHEQFIELEEETIASSRLKKNKENATKAALEGDECADIDTMRNGIYLNDIALQDRVNSLQENAVTVDGEIEHVKNQVENLDDNYNDVTKKDNNTPELNLWKQKLKNMDASIANVEKPKIQPLPLFSDLIPVIAQTSTNVKAKRGPGRPRKKDRTPTPTNLSDSTFFSSHDSLKQAKTSTNVKAKRGPGRPRKKDRTPTPTKKKLKVELH